MRDAGDKAIFDIVSKAEQRNVVALPFALELENDADAFLYAAKAYLRDLLKLLNLFYGAHFEEASSWFTGSNKAPPQFSGQKIRLVPETAGPTALPRVQHWSALE